MNQLLDDRMIQLDARLDELYQSAVDGNNDIREQIPRLRDLALQCKHVTEFGLRGGNSTAALLNGVTKNGGSMVSYDKDPCSGEKTYSEFPNWTFVLGNSLEVDIDPTDLLFIDTVHTGKHLEKELERHAAKVSKWIALHDTEEYRTRGDDGKEGMWEAIARFTLQHDDWRVKDHYPESNGLTVLERV